MSPTGVYERKQEYSSTPIDTAEFRHLLDRHGVPHKRLSEQLGYHHSLISQYLRRGKGNYYTLDTICAALGCRVEDVMR